MEYNKDKIGVGITTYNSENYFKDLYNSIDKSFINEIVVVNGGDEYIEKYDCDWIQHKKNHYPAQSRNDCISYLMNRKCEHIFLIEDDMIIKNSDIFNQYIRASKVSGIRYFSYVSMGADCGSPENRTPRTMVDYGYDIKVNLYLNMCNEFTYHHYTTFKEVGLYDPVNEMRNAFDVDMTYRETKINKWTTPFWWFADIYNSDQYIKNNPNATSRLQAERPDGSRTDLILQTMNYFKQKHNLSVNQIPDVDKDIVMNTLKRLKNENSIRD
jgi:glycosyltransferase involved in cell wall biosynthesis